MNGVKMKKMKFIISLFLLSIIASTNLFSQEFDADELRAIEELKQKPLHGLFGISFTNSVPQNDFYSNMKHSGPGLSLYGGYTFAPVPVTIGLQSDLLFYGSYTKYYTHRNPAGWVYARDTVSFTNLVIPITAFVQFRPSVSDIVFPYMEAFAGVTMISASADFKTVGYEDTKNEFNATLNYGLGVGTMVKLVDFITLPNFRSCMLLDMKARYMRGRNTNYFIVERINQDSSPEFKKSESKTDMVTFQVGLVFEF